MPKKKYYAAGLAAFIIWGFVSFGFRPLKAYPSLDILFYRVFASAIFMILAVVIFRKQSVRDSLQLYRSMSTQERKKNLLLTFLGGIFLTANWLFFIYTMNHISIKSASYAYLVCPILTTVLAYFMLNEHLKKFQWYAVALSVISCVLLAYNALHELLYSMIIALSYAFYLISQRKNNRFDKFIILSVQMIFAALILLPFYPFYSAAVPSESFFYLMILLIAVVFTILPLFLNLYALKEVNSSTMGILLYINPLINFVIAVLYYKESSSSLQLLSYSLILLSIVYFNKDNIKKLIARGN